LLRILRFVFGQVPNEEAIPLVRQSQNRPNCLSPSAVHLVRDTLSKGCILYLVRAGGWKKEQFLRDGQPKAGRLWERSGINELTLEFSRHSMEFLIWLTANKPGETKPMWKAPASELTIADHLLLFLVYEALREEKDIAAFLRCSSSFASNPLCHLLYPGDFAGEATDESLSFDGWFTSTGGLIIEAMQPILEDRWLQMERDKGQIGDWERMRAEGQEQTRILDLFLDAADRANRWDLTRFLLAVLDAILATPDLTPTFWTGGLQGSGPTRLADRLETQRSALAVLRCAERLRQWEQRARTSGFMDDDYAASKFWLGEYERFNGRQSTSRAEGILEMLEPL